MRGSQTIERDDATPVLSRRALLRGAALGTAVVGSGAASVLLSATPAEASASFAPKDQGLHLLRRATHGPTPATLAEIRKMGADKWLDQQLKPGSINDQACEKLIKSRFPRLQWSIVQATNTLDFGWDLMFDLGVASIARATWSKRQLLEVMVDFWSNHLNVTNPSDGVWSTRHDYDRTVIRKHALGKYSDMLVASATHPSMMVYLNNAESTKDQPNENYGRELLELHSVGVEAGYSEEEMYNSTLIMTGFAIDWDTYLFRYYPDWHYTGSVKVLGWSSSNSSENGRDLGLKYVRYLAHHPATARRIARKLCERFVGDKPPAPLVTLLAKTYLKNDTAIVPVLRALFASKSFADSVGQKVRRPREDIVATLRALGMGPDKSGGTEGMQGLYWMISDLGDLPLAWSQPNGYPDTADAWRSAGSSLGRWNSHMSLAAHWWPSQLSLPDLRKHLLPKKLPKTHGEMIDALAKRLVFRTLSSSHRAAVLGFVRKGANAPLSEGDNSVNNQLASVVSLILDSPYFQVR